MEWVLRPHERVNVPRSHLFWYVVDQVEAEDESCLFHCFVLGRRAEIVLHRGHWRSIDCAEVNGREDDAGVNGNGSAPYSYGYTEVNESESVPCSNGDAEVNENENVACSES